MKLLIVSHTPHWEDQNEHFAYGPYVREMNLWIKYADEVEVVAPLSKKSKTAIHWRYNKKIRLKNIRGLSFVSFRESVVSLFKIPLICYTLFIAMRQADHIHLRCPGNIGLLGCLVQIVFPSKRKTAKYAGNWDPKAAQPKSYKLQKSILSNTRLTKNMQVLVYGEWPRMNHNIKPFFTASYPESRKERITKVLGAKLHFLFVGSLVSGKRPDYAIAMVKELAHRGYSVQLDVYGDGALRFSLEQEDLSYVQFYGNTNADIVYEAYKKAHFIILPSKSEGWPKVIAEAMFCGVIPIATSISCVPWMLDNGNRGQLMSLDLEQDCNNLTELLGNEQACLDMSIKAQEWSQHYTLDSFEKAIKKLV